MSTFSTRKTLKGDKILNIYKYIDTTLVSILYTGNNNWKKLIYYGIPLYAKLKDVYYDRI